MTTAPLFKIGGLKFDSRIIQGPLAGYSNAAFRQLLWNFGGLAYACTEMLPATLVTQEQHDASNRFTWRHPNEKTLCYQLSGNCPDTLTQAAKQLTQLGADLIDLNAGCPKTKIRKKKSGSALLENPYKMQQLISAIKLGISLNSTKNSTNKPTYAPTITTPVTVKIRIPNPKSLEQTRELVLALCESGVDAIIIHGRHWQDDYQTPMHLTHIATAVESASCPIIANGDVENYHDYQNLLSQTGAAAIMVARAGFGAPWLFNHLSTQEQTGKQSVPPTPKAIGQLLLRHLDNLKPFMSEKMICLQSRTIAKYYAKHLDVLTQNELRQQLNHCKPHLPTVAMHITSYFK